MKLIKALFSILEILVPPFYFLLLTYEYFGNKLIPNNYQVMIMVVLTIQYFSKRK